MSGVDVRSFGNMLFIYGLYSLFNELCIYLLLMFLLSSLYVSTKLGNKVKALYKCIRLVIYFLPTYLVELLARSTQMVPMFYNMLNLFQIVLQHW